MVNICSVLIVLNLTVLPIKFRLVSGKVGTKLSDLFNSICCSDYTITCFLLKWDVKYRVRNIDNFIFVRGKTSKMSLKHLEGGRGLCRKS